MEAHIREQLQAEALGNTLGCLITTLGYDEQALPDQTRNQLLQRSLEILGDGQAYNRFLFGRGELSQVERLLRDVFGREISRLQQVASSNEPYAAHQAGQTLKWAESLPELAKAADTTVLRRREDARQQAQVKARLDDQSRQETRQRLDHGRALIRELEVIREHLLDFQAQSAAIDRMGGRSVDEIIQIDKTEGTSPTINLAVRPEVLDQARKRADELRHRLEQQDLEPTQRRHLRNDLAQQEAELQFLEEIGRLVEQVNSSSYKTTWTKVGMLGRGKKVFPVFLRQAFKQLPQLKYEALAKAVAVGSAEEDLREALKPQVPNEPTQEIITQQIDEVLKAEDVLPYQDQILHIESILQRRATAAKRLQSDLSSKLRQGTAYQATAFVLNELQNHLQEEELLRFQ